MEDDVFRRVEHSDGAKASSFVTQGVNNDNNQKNPEHTDR